MPVWLHVKSFRVSVSAGKGSVLHQENSSIDTGQVDIGKRVGQGVPPGVFWRSQLNLEQPRFLKFNISVQKNALIGVYGRKGLAPSHTQVSFQFGVFFIGDTFHSDTHPGTHIVSLINSDGLYFTNPYVTEPVDNIYELRSKCKWRKTNQLVNQAATGQSFLLVQRE